MTFAEKLRNSRKETGMSQEVLAEKLGVSRQAVTKWETGRGIPDIENMMIISNLFGISVDEFLSQEKETAVSKGFLYESRTEYDIDGNKRFDMKLGGAAALNIAGTDSEKIIVKLGSNDITTLESDFKVKIDDIKGRIDVDVNRAKSMTEAKAKEHLTIEVLLPEQFLDNVELESNCGELNIYNITCENIEYKGKVNTVSISSVSATIELDSNSDIDISVDDFAGSLEINQRSATSKLHVADDFAFKCISKGLSTAVSYEINGKDAEDFSDPEAETIVEHNGIKSELVISRG